MEKNNLNDMNEEIKENGVSPETSENNETTAGSETIEAEGEITEADVETTEAEGEVTETDGEAAEADGETTEKSETAEKTNGKTTKKKKNKKKKNTEGLKRNSMATVMTIVFIAVVVVLNILVGLLNDRFPSMDIDLTAEKMNTLSDQAMEIAESITQDTEIYLIGSESDWEQNNMYYASYYGLDYTQVVSLSKKLVEANSYISMDYIDPDTNPSFISQYADDSLTSGTVLIRTESRYRVLYASDLFSVSQDSSYNTTTYSKVDSALAGALELVNMDKVPVVTIATGHNEMLSTDTMSEFIDMMESQNFIVQEINIMTDEIPEDTQVIMIPTPSNDYTTEEIEKLRAYVDDDTHDFDTTILVTFHTTQGDLPNLEGFLEEWGIRVEDGVVAESDSSRMISSNASYIMVDANQEDMLTENEYNTLVSPASRPITLLFTGNGDYATSEVWTTADSAYIVTEDMTELPDDPETSTQIVAAAASKYEGTARRSVLVFGSSYVFTDSFISATAYGDGYYVRDVLQFLTGVDATRVSVTTQTVQTNVLDVEASTSLTNILGLGVFTIGLPIVILIVGLVVFLRRRHL